MCRYGHTRNVRVVCLLLFFFSVLVVIVEQHAIDSRNERKHERVESRGHANRSIRRWR